MRFKKHDAEQRFIVLYTNAGHKSQSGRKEPDACGCGEQVGPPGRNRPKRFRLQFHTGNSSTAADKKPRLRDTTSGPERMIKARRNLAARLLVDHLTRMSLGENPIGWMARMRQPEGETFGMIFRLYSKRKKSR